MVLFCAVFCPVLFCSVWRVGGARQPIWPAGLADTHYRHPSRWSLSPRFALRPSWTGGGRSRLRQPCLPPQPGTGARAAPQVGPPGRDIDIILVAAAPERHIIRMNEGEASTRTTSQLLTLISVYGQIFATCCFFL